MLQRVAIDQLKVSVECMKYRGGLVVYVATREGLAKCAMDPAGGMKTLLV